MKATVVAAVAAVCLLALLPHEACAQNNNCTSTEACVGDTLPAEKGESTRVDCTAERACQHANVVLVRNSDNSSSTLTEVSLNCTGEAACDSINVYLNPAEVVCGAGACSRMLVSGVLEDPYEGEGAVVTCTGEGACESAQFSIQQQNGNVGLCCIGAGSCNNVQITSQFRMCCEEGACSHINKASGAEVLPESWCLFQEGTEPATCVFPWQDGYGGIGNGAASAAGSIATAAVAAVMFATAGAL